MSQPPSPPRSKVRAALLPITAAVLLLAVLGLCGWCVYIALSTPGFYQ